MCFPTKVLSAQAQKLQDLKLASWSQLAKDGQIMEYVLTHERWILVSLLLPANALWLMCVAVMEKVSFLMSTSAKHDAKVANVQKQVQQWNKDGRPMPMCTARPGWKVMSLRVGNYKKTHRAIDVSLDNIIGVDEEAMLVHVEPLVNMGQITQLLGPLGWTLQIIPELDDLTVGGLIAGFGIESQSHKYGLFQNIVAELEIVLASGELVKCSPENNPELFYNVFWSYGSLGFIVSAKLKMLKLRKYVHLKYLPFTKKQDYVDCFIHESSKANPAEFVEGLVYSRDRGVVMVGEFTDHPDPKKINHINAWYKPFFYKQAEAFIGQGQVEEYIPIRDYYHRHTRGIFWELLDIIPFALNPLFLFLFGWLLPIKISLLKLTQTETTRRLYEENHVVQDMLVPVKTLSESLDVFENLYDLYPLWLCPMKVCKTPVRGVINPTGDEDEMFVDMGAYGNPKSANYNHIETSRAVEEHVRKVKGFQALYADCYMTRAEFREMFDHTNLDELRKKYDCIGAFPEPYDKVCKKART